MSVPIERQVTTTDIKEYLRKKYSSKNGEWFHFAELRVGTGYGKSNEQYLDYYAVHCYGEKRSHAYEIKVSRSDFQKEMKQPLKRRRGLLFSNYFSFITPKGLVKPQEIPPECGLIELQWACNTDEIQRYEKWLGEVEALPEENCAECERLRKEVRYWRRPCDLHQERKKPEYEEWLSDHTPIAAPFRECFPPTWSFVAAIGRRMLEHINHVEKVIVEADNRTRHFMDNGNDSKEVIDLHCRLCQSMNKNNCMYCSPFQEMAL